MSLNSMHWWKNLSEGTVKICLEYETYSTDLAFNFKLCQPFEKSYLFCPSLRKVMLRHSKTACLSFSKHSFKLQIILLLNHHQSPPESESSQFVHGRECLCLHDRTLGSVKQFHPSFIDTFNLAMCSIKVTRRSFGLMLLSRVPEWLSLSPGEK